MGYLLITSSLIILFLLYCYVKNKSVESIPEPVQINRYDVPVFNFYSVIKISEIELKSLLRLPLDKYVDEALISKLSQKIAEELQKSGTIEKSKSIKDGFEEYTYGTKIAFLK